MTTSHTPALTKLFPALMSGDEAALLALFAEGERVVDAPIFGEARGDEAIRRLAGSLRERLALGKARLERIATSETSARVVDEVTLYLPIDGREVELPVAVVADRAGQDRYSAIRIYFSTWPLSGSHLVRAPLFRSDPSLVPPDVVGRYFDRLDAADLEAVMALFIPEGRLRQPSGSAYEEIGEEARRKFYSTVFALGGGVTLGYNTFTDDGVRCAIEYNVVRAGKMEVTPQAGMVVYERAPNGLISAVRIYDDFNIPT
jgi:ketosteroid isomerase-like protein